MTFKKKYARIFDRDDFPAPKYKKLAKFLVHITSYQILGQYFSSIGLLVKFVMRHSPRKKTTTTSFPELFRLSGENPEEVEVQQYSFLDVTSILFIDTCLPSLSKSWLCGPVKWLTEETTNRFKSNAGSYLRVKNRSIGREKNKAFRAE